MFSLRHYCLDVLIFTIMIDSKFHFSPTFTSNLFFQENKNDIRLKHMTSFTLVKCNSMIISIVMPSYPNLLCVFATSANIELMLVLWI